MVKNEYGLIILVGPAYTIDQYYLG